MITVRRIIQIALLAVSVGALAAPPDDAPPMTKPEVTASIDNSAFIDANRILMFAINRGGFGRDLSAVFGYDQGTFWPYEGDTSLIAGNIENAARRSVLYDAGLWIAGIDSATADTVVAISEYGSEFVPGPMQNGTFMPDEPSFRTYKLYRDSLWSNPNEDYRQWPTDQGAPTDEWGNPIMYGRQMLWSVCNDADPAAHTLSDGGTAPLGIEVHQKIWAGDTVGEDVIYYGRLYPVEQIGNSRMWVRAWTEDAGQVTGNQYRVTFGDTLVTDTSDIGVIDTSYYFVWHLDNLSTGQRVLENQLPDSIPRYAEGIGVTVEGDLRGFINFEVVANASGPLDPTEAGAAAWAGFPVPVDADDEPLLPTDNQQATGDGRWLFHVVDNGGTSGGGTRGDYEAFLINALGSSPSMSNIGYYDFEMRFTGSYDNPGVGGSYCLDWAGDVFWVPFELWRIGSDTPDDPSDDLRLIPMLADGWLDWDDGDDIFGLENWGSAADGSCFGACEHSVSDGDDDPWTDAVYWYIPEDETPGEAGYLDAEAQMLAGTLQEWMLPYPPAMRRTVLVNWDAGQEPPFGQTCPEQGTVFRLTTYKPVTPPDTFTFTASEPPSYTGTLEGSTVYIEYKLYNKGENTINGMYIGVWNDPDLGGAGDDFVGCDTLNNIWLCYNSDDEDMYYGPAPPALGFKLLFGPVMASPGDTAYFDGQQLPDYCNMPMSAFSHIIQGTLNNYQAVYAYMRGQTPVGPYVYEGDTLTYFYSGDPVTGTGSLDYAPYDRRMVASCGPIDFRPGDSQYVLIRMAVGRGDDHLSSITAVKEILNEPFDPLRDPFSGEPPPVPQRFLLSQNYPNPFNPTTTIEYSLPREARVTIDIYNILGQRVRRLVDEVRPAGEHRVVWDGTAAGGRTVSSGLYFYRVSADHMSDCKKMVLIK